MCMDILLPGKSMRYRAKVITVSIAIAVYIFSRKKNLLVNSELLI